MMQPRTIIMDNGSLSEKTQPGRTGDRRLSDIIHNACLCAGSWARPLRRRVAALIDAQLSAPQEVRECAAVSAALHQLTKIRKHTCTHTHRSDKWQH